MPSQGLEAGKRRAARFALYGGLVTLGIAMAALVGSMNRLLEEKGRWAEQRLEDDPYVELLRDYVRLPTITGQEKLGAEFLREQLAAAGIDATLEPIGDGQANLWAILEGEDPEALVLHHHIDVTSVQNPEEWVQPPFEAVIDGPFLYGRGVFDMKSYGVAQLAAFLDIAKSGKPLRRSLMLLATSDEERGGKLGTQWVLSQHPELAERMWGVLTEGGAVEALNPEQIKYWGIEASQMRIIRARACSPSRSRLEALRDDLAQWPATDRPVQITPELLRFFETYGPTRSYQWTRVGLAETNILLRDQRWFDLLPSFLRDLMVDSVVAQSITGSPEEGYTLDLTILLVPGTDPEEALTRLLPDWLTHGITLSIPPAEGAAHGSSLNHPLFLDTAAALQDAYPDATVGSYALPYNITDARFFRDRGIPTYGYSPFLFFSTDTVRADRLNERIPLPGFVSGVELYIDTVRELVLAE